LRLVRQGKKALGAEKGFTPVSTVTGVMIAYATAPGRTASDTLEEVRVAREMATAAEEQRLAGAQAAADATQAAKAAVKKDGGDARIVIAALPNIDAPSQNFDGNWTVNNSSQTCSAKGGTNRYFRCDPLHNSGTD
jgi:hypothetical protein